MDINEYIGILNNVIADYESQLPNLASTFALDLLDGINERIQTTGASSDGSSLKPYTDSYLNFKKKPGKYKRGRDLGLASSRYTGVVDYSLTGEMWRNIGIIEESVSGNSVRLKVGGRNELTRTKLESLSNRDSEVLEPSDSEIDYATRNADNQIDRILSPLK